MAYQLYIGDLHSHCSISYGHGSVRQALLRARQQLDFCSITGHAFWPDMPTDRTVYGDIIDYHTQGFGRLARNWEQLLQEQELASEPGRFVALPSYEWHSLRYGDHNVYAAGPRLPLRDAPDLPQLRQVAAESQGIVVPHHIGYAAGYRGIDWREFREERSPVVEIYSLHGCSESDEAPYPMLHDMGPRDAGSTAEAGWAMGYRFGVIASTDHHGAYPGSHGDGRAAVWATALTRQSLWEALLARRVYALTGDPIEARLFIDDAWIGQTIRAPGRRRIRVEVRGCDALDRVELLRNGRVVRRFDPLVPDLATDVGGYRLRITWGWGRREHLVRWQAELHLTEGTIDHVDPCFSGRPIVAPVQQHGDAEVPDDEDLPHEILQHVATSVAWRSSTVGNLSTRHATTQALSLEITAPLRARLRLDVNGQRYEHALVELLHAARCHYLRGWLSEAVRIGPLVPSEECTCLAVAEDEPQLDVDVYRLRVSQHNGQWAWLTPIWAER
jgi:hypothetical protein